MGKYLQTFFSNYQVYKIAKPKINKNTKYYSMWEKLFDWKIKSDQKFKFCDKTDSIIHFFLLCDNTRNS